MINDFALGMSDKPRVFKQVGRLIDWCDSTISESNTNVNLISMKSINDIGGVKLIMKSKNRMIM